jgi:NADH:ubiquinone oxidoreductase subunit F (NADH-binding)
MRGREEAMPTAPGGPGGHRAPGGAAGHRAPGGAGGLPRLLHGGPPEGLREHLDRLGPIPFRGRQGGAGQQGGRQRGGAAGRGEGMLIDSIERAGLTGRGGADFPTARKMRAVLDSSRAAFSDRGRAVVVANGAESEPISAKDRALLAGTPHLVLDGISLAAESIGAGEAFLCVDGEHEGLIRHLAEAVEARQRSGTDATSVRVAAVPTGYVASEESALVHLLNGGPALPTFVPPRPFQKGVRGRPTLVSNVETLANIALIARYGPDWFRGVGTRAAPGSALITIAGSVRKPGVHEIALGTSMHEVMAAAGGLAEAPQAILAGGYFGGWLPASGALDLPVSGPDLRAAGASLGAGILAVVPESACGIAETARIARYLAGQSAGQCGPCVNGLPAIADAMEHIAWRGRDPRAQNWLTQLFGLVEGRGACHFPDGAARLVASALRVFAADVRQHLRRGPCDRARRAPTLPVPGLGPDPAQPGRLQRAAARA